MHTDASHRFERGVDPELPRAAVERATALILQIAGGKPGPLTEAAWKEHLRPHPAVRLRRARLARILGMDVPANDVERILLALGMAVQSDAEGWQVTPPSRRFDIAIEEDLIEEIARIRGYDAVPLHAPTGQIQLGTLPEARTDIGDIRRQLCARGYFEAINYAFLDAATLAAWSLDAEAVRARQPAVGRSGRDADSAAAGSRGGAQAQHRAPAGTGAAVRNRPRLPPRRTTHRRRPCDWPGWPWAARKPSNGRQQARRRLLRPEGRRGIVAPVRGNCEFPLRACVRTLAAPRPLGRAVARRNPPRRARPPASSACASD
jgi:hypothetical protein